MTTVTLLTPLGRGALATIAVEGSRAAELVARQFRTAAQRPFQTLPLGRIALGRWMHADGPGEEVVVCRCADHCVEVHCHGGRAAAEAIIASLAALGARPLDQTAWAQTHADDAIQAAAWSALAQARTERTAAVLLDQYRGALRRALLEIRDLCDSGRNADDWEAAGRRLARLARLAPVGAHLTSPWRVVLAGPPNVGKSSLVNAILGYQRSIVFGRPGTTRDLVTSQTALDGWPVRLSDTAGLREAGDQIESEGVARARQELSAADLVVLVVDATDPASTAGHRHLDEWPDALIVGNKADLLAPSDGQPAWRELKRDLILTSALTGSGIPQLIQAMQTRIVPDTPLPGEAVPFTAQQSALVAAALARHQQGDRSAIAELLGGLLAAAPGNQPGPGRENR